MNCRIVLTGASGTGKSTLAQYLVQKTGLPLNPVGSRQVALEMGFVNDKGEPEPYLVDRANLLIYESYLQDFDPRKSARAAVLNYNPGSPTCRSLFALRLLEAKVKWENEVGAFISDRSTIDNLTYTALNGMKSLTEEYIDLALAHAKTYTASIFVPMSSFYHPGDDAARKVDGDQRAADRTFEALLLGFYQGVASLWRVEPFDLDARYRRLDQILDELRAYPVNPAVVDLHDFTFGKG